MQLIVAIFILLVNLGALCGRPVTPESFTLQAVENKVSHLLDERDRDKVVTPPAQNVVVAVDKQPNAFQMPVEDAGRKKSNGKGVQPGKMGKGGKMKRIESDAPKKKSKKSKKKARKAKMKRRSTLRPKATKKLSINFGNHGVTVPAIKNFTIFEPPTRPTPVHMIQLVRLADKFDPLAAEMKFKRQNDE